MSTVTFRPQSSKSPALTSGTVLRGALFPITINRAWFSSNKSGTRYWKMDGRVELYLHPLFISMCHTSRRRKPNPIQTLSICGLLRLKMVTFIGAGLHYPSIWLCIRKCNKFSLEHVEDTYDPYERKHSICRMHTLVQFAIATKYICL